MTLTTRLFRRESEDVYRALVADLTLTLIPTSIMGLTLVGVGVLVWRATGNGVFFLAALVGGFGSLAKLVLMATQKRHHPREATDLRDTVRWERRHGIATVVVAASVGVCCAAAFRGADLRIHMLMTALLFGYCSGVVSRLGIRPRIAYVALLLAAIPAIATAAHTDESGHRILAIMFGIFLLGAFETVNHVHRTAVRYIQMQLDMASLARHDALTGLANRLGLQEAFRRETSQGGRIAVHCIDLDGFKAVNDRYGHAGGDEVLVAVAQRLLAAVPLDATVARVGGDEFVVLQGGGIEEAEVSTLAADIEAALCQPYALGEGIVAVSGSVGYALADGTAGFGDMLRVADEASYRAKRRTGERGMR
ncbi:GGDEF domain-containing protein [Luteibacter sp. PPL201]|uniref:GGDEF domain-containing protein n=1 Tax=Luteibacter sahnii TaxID=3021977 RepID=A0ABT6BBZ7_9GAMM|nr:GGDEF domain-containing protein [Luteibacter sp. PPL193]MDY1547616.1 GGDEF domain-containing protein [Luteibacter sp. PPL193]